MKELEIELPYKLLSYNISLNFNRFSQRSPFPHYVHKIFHGMAHILGCFFCSEVFFSKGHPYSKYCLYEYILNPKFQDFSMRFGTSKINRSFFTKLLSSRSNQRVLMITSMNFKTTKTHPKILKCCF